MQNLKDAPPKEKAKRIRQLAVGVNNPADVAMIEQYASQLEREAATEEKPALFQTPEE